MCGAERDGHLSPLSHSDEEEEEEEVGGFSWIYIEYIPYCMVPTGIGPKKALTSPISQHTWAAITTRRPSPSHTDEKMGAYILQERTLLFLYRAIDRADSA